VEVSLRALTALDAGAELDGLSRVRVTITDGGTFYVKYARRTGECRKAPANELVGHRILEFLGVRVAQIAAVEMPTEISDLESSLSDLLHPVGFGLEEISGAFELIGFTIGARLTTASADETAAAWAALNLTGQTDHAVANWLDAGDRVVPVDFARSPSDPVWAGADLNGPVTSHGGIDIRSLSAHARGSVAERVRELDRPFLTDVGRTMPLGWTEGNQFDEIVDRILMRKEAVCAGLG
jgi:hypothetical protein